MEKLILAGDTSPGALGKAGCVYKVHFEDLLSLKCFPLNHFAWSRLFGHSSLPEGKELLGLDIHQSCQGKSQLDDSLVLTQPQVVVLRGSREDLECS